MPRKPTGPRDTEDAFRTIGEELKRKAHAPNIHGYGPHGKQNNFHSMGVLNHKGIDTYFDPFNLRDQLIKIRLYIGGNRSGKTVGGVVEDLWWVTKTHPYINVDAIWSEPIRGRLVTTDFSSGWEKIIYPIFQRWTPLSYLRGQSWATAWDKENKTIHFADRVDSNSGRIIRGGFIEIMTHEQDLEKFAGASRHFVHFDEECSEEIYKECLARLIDTGGCAWMTETPVEGMTWTFETLYEPGTNQPRDPQIMVTEVDMADNPYITEEERSSFIALLSPDEIAARVHGNYVRKGGLIYKDFNDDPRKGLCHVIESFIPPKNYLWVVSMDHGLNNPSAWYWSAINFEGRVITFFEHYERNWVINQHAERVKQINTGFGREPDYYVGDPSIRNKMPNTGTSVFEEYVKYGIIILHQDNLNDVDAGIERVTRYLRTVDREVDGTEVPYWLITKNCEKLIWEMKRYRWRVFMSKKAEANNNPTEQPVKKDDHACDSTRYLFMSRPDLKAIRDGSRDAFRHDEVMPASVVYSINSPKKDVDLQVAAFTHPGQYQEKGEYAGSSKTGWQFDEYMGGEW